MRRFIFSIVVLAVVSAMFAGTENRDGRRVEELARKADYAYLEARAKIAEDDYAGAFDLLGYAYSLDSTQSALNSDYGFYSILANTMGGDPDSATVERGYARMLEAYNSGECDYYSSVLFANLSERLNHGDIALAVWERLDSLYPKKPDAGFKFASALCATGDTANIMRAIGIFDQLQRTHGTEVGIVSQKMNAYILIGDTLSTLAALDTLLQSHPRGVNENLFAGDVMMAFKRDSDAVGYYNRAIEIDSVNGMAYFKLAQYYQLQGDSARYDEEVFKALSQPDLEVEDKVELMRGYVQGLYADSLQRGRIENLFGVLTDMHPLEPRIRDLFSSYLAVIGDYKRAAEQTEILADMDPATVENWNRLVTIYLSDNDAANAAKAGERGLGYHENDATLAFLTGSAEIVADNPVRAIELLRGAIAAADSRDLKLLSQMQCTLGDAFYKNNEPDSAFHYYDVALSTDGTNVLAMNNCAYYLACENRDLDRAEQLSFWTIKEDPDNATSLDTYAWVMFKQKKFDSAKEYIDKALEHDTEPSAELYEHAGDIYFMNLDPERAVEYWKEALTLDPDNELLRRKIEQKTYLQK